MVNSLPRAAVFDALSDPTRLAMVTMLIERERPVSQLAAPFSISLPATLKHLKILEEAGLATSRKVGRERLCTLDPRPFDEIRDWATSVRKTWNLRLDSLERYLARTADQEPN